MPYEKLERTIYAGAGTTLSGLSLNGNEFEHDFVKYHDVRAQLHEKAQHDRGVAAGLEVTLTKEGLIQVSPGVAVDVRGRLVALSDADAGGGGIVGTIDPAGSEYQGLGSPACVTIRYATQDPAQKSDANSDFMELRVQPKVGLEDPATLGDDSEAVVLAVVELGAHRKASKLHARLEGVPVERKLVGVPAGEIRLRRSESMTKDGQPPTVRDTVAVTLRPTKEGDGVEIDGRAKVKAIDVQDKVSTKGLEVTGEAKVAGLNVGGKATANYLEVTREAKVAGLNVGGQATAIDLILTGEAKVAGLNVGGQATAKGLEVTGEAKVAGLNVGGKATANYLEVTREAKVAGLNVGGQATAKDLDVTGEAKVAGLNVGGKATAKDLDVTGEAKVAGLNVGGKATAKELEVNETATFRGNIKTDKMVDGRRISVDGQNLDAHLANKNNPHGVTLQQLGPLSTDGKMLTASGNVGIGTAPDAKARLTVVGGTDQRWFAEFRPEKATFTFAPKIGPEGSTPGTSSRRARSAAATTATRNAI